MTTPLTSGSTIVTVPLAPSTKVVAPPQSTNVLTSPGRVGPPGAGVNLAGAVANYAALPTDLGPSDAGQAYVVNSNGKLYVWDGTSFPLEANGSAFKGDTGNPGRGITDITLDVDDLEFSMSDASVESVTIPAITAANASAVAAANSASVASGHATDASNSATSASTSASASSTSASAASTSATNAASSASTATTKASEASGHASTASTAATNASTSATNAGNSAAAAATSASDAGGYATTAGTARDGAVAAQGAAETAEDNASASATASASSAADAAASAEEAAEVVATGIPNATAVVKGGILLPGGVAGELGGTYDHPTVTGWADKADLVSGKIPSSQLPVIALVSTQVVANEAARLALTAQTGDIAVQTGNPGRGTYILRGTDPTVSGDWELMVAPTDSVSSVNGYQGIVVLAKADVGLSNVDNTSDASKPVSSAAQTALDGKAAASHTHAGADITSGTVAYARLPVGTTASTIAAGNDSRFTDARTPTAHVHAGADISSGTVAYARLPVGTAASTVAAGDDSRFTNTRTPSANTVPADFVFVAISPGTTRSTTEDWTNGQYVGRAFTLTGVTYQFETADASGNTSVEVQRRTGAGAYSTVTNTNLTISAANQADTAATDAARTNASAVSQSFGVGDRINVICTAVGTTPGKGLRVYLLGTWN